MMKVGAIALLVVACSGGDFQSAGGSAGVGGSAAGASSGGTGGSEPGAGGSSSGAGGSSSGAGGSSSGAGGVLGGVGGSAPGFGGSAGSASAGSGAGGSESTGGNGGGSSGGHGGAAGASSSGGSGPGGTGGTGSSDAVLWSETFTHHNNSTVPQTAVTGVRLGLSVWRETDPPTECSDVSDVVAPGWTGVTEFDPGYTGACAKNPSTPSHRFWVYAKSSTGITAGQNLEIPEGESLSWTVTKLRRTITENTWPTPAGGTSLDIEVKWEILGTQ